MSVTGEILDFIPYMADKFPHPIAERRKMMGASVCKWIADYDPCDWATWERTLGDYEHRVDVESGIDEDGKPFALMIEWENLDLKKYVVFEGCTSEDLADIGRVFLNAAIAARRAERGVK